MLGAFLAQPAGVTVTRLSGCLIRTWDAYRLGYLAQKGIAKSLAQFRSVLSIDTALSMAAAGMAASWRASLMLFSIHDWLPDTSHVRVSADGPELYPPMNRTCSRRHAIFNAAEMSLVWVGRTKRATSFPSRISTRVGQSLTR
jgi:hypothetical protein